jgi:hypothetical protein
MLKELAKVNRVDLVVEGHGILTMYIELRFGTSTLQSFGGYQIDVWDEKKNRRVGTAAGADLICRILQLFDVTSLGKIEGRTVYALRDEGKQDIVGLQVPEFDGNAKFLVDDWREEWF